MEDPGPPLPEALETANMLSVLRHWGLGSEDAQTVMALLHRRLLRVESALRHGAWLPTPEEERASDLAKAVAEEREACASLCDEYAIGYSTQGQSAVTWEPAPVNRGSASVRFAELASALREAARAIRARSTKDHGPAVETGPQHTDPAKETTP